MTTVLLDVGNSRCKWGLWQDGKIDRTGVMDNEDLDDRRHWRFAEAADHAVACSVAGDATTLALVDALSTENIDVTLAKTTGEHAGVRCAYRDPTRLGVDRWMAVLAGSRLPQLPALVVDAGTALTIDAVDAEGNHAGGYIIPGIGLMQSALTSRTANIRVDAPEAIEEVFGASTSEAVRNGALVAASGAVMRSAAQLADMVGVDVGEIQFAFTGGDGELLAKAVNRECDFHANFVLEGLAIYAGLGA